jgi:hypothetical protein
MSKSTIQLAVLSSAACMPAGSQYVWNVFDETNSVAISGRDSTLTIPPFLLTSAHSYVAQLTVTIGNQAVTASPLSILIAGISPKFVVTPGLNFSVGVLEDINIDCSKSSNQESQLTLKPVWTLMSAVMPTKDATGGYASSILSFSAGSLPPGVHIFKLQFTGWRDFVLVYVTVTQQTPPAVAIVPLTSYFVNPVRQLNLQGSATVVGDTIDSYAWAVITTGKRDFY